MQQLVDNSSAVYDNRLVAPKAVVVIGASTGGPSALSKILPKFSKSFPAAIVVVQHMRPGFTRLVAAHMNETSAMVIEEVDSARVLSAGSALFAPSDSAVSIAKTEGPMEMYTLMAENVATSLDLMRKRIDSAMISAAQAFGSRTIGILLTGMGDDGRAGLRAIREAGGRTLAQDEATSVVYDMPRAALDMGVVDESIPLWNIADRIAEIVGEI